MASLHGDRRADVLIENENGNKIAIELQHSNIDLDQIEKRSNSYAKMGVAQLWIPLLRQNLFVRKCALDDGSWEIQRYPAHKYEIWLGGFYHKTGQIPMFSVSDGKIWLCSISPCNIYVEETSYYDSDGEERTSGGNWKKSKRYRTLILRGPFSLTQLSLSTSKRPKFSNPYYNWPEATFGVLKPTPFT